MRLELIEYPMASFATSRLKYADLFLFEVAVVGVWSFRLSSGDVDLGRIDIEVKAPVLQ